MADAPATIPAYIEAAPPQSHAHLNRIHALLREVAPEAEEAIKWGVPYLVEPRFLFSFAAFKAHLAFVTSQEILGAFREEAEADGYATTKNFLKVRYDQPLPEALIRQMAAAQVEAVRQRKTDSFW